MNKALIMGRMVRDPEIRTTPAQVKVATFTLAVDRKFKNANGERQADFIPVVAWRNTAEFVEKYFKKGSKMIVIGSIQTRTYDDKDGKKVYVTEIVADEVEFAESKKDDGQATFTQPAQGEFYAPADDDTNALPFDL